MGKESTLHLVLRLRGGGVFEMIAAMTYGPGKVKVAATKGATQEEVARGLTASLSLQPRSHEKPSAAFVCLLTRRRFDLLT